MFTGQFGLRLQPARGKHRFRSQTHLPHPPSQSQTFKFSLDALAPSLIFCCIPGWVDRLPPPLLEGVAFQGPESCGVSVPVPPRLCCKVTSSDPRWAGGPSVHLWSPGIPSLLLATRTCFSSELIGHCCCLVKSRPTFCDPLPTPPRTVAHQVPLSMGSPRQEYWNGLPFPSPGDLPNPGIERTPPALAGGCFTDEPLSIHIFRFLVFIRFYSAEDSTGASHSALMMKSRLLEATPLAYTWFPLIFTIPGRKYYCAHESDEETEAQGGERRPAWGGGGRGRRLWRPHLLLCPPAGCQRAGRLTGALSEAP